ncbi:MAG: hypothetical protein LBL90_10365 [Prevotellaceae bacterium]|jgi:hypothetical protein|nr:hypothetical protein [Prevotellaceae bacterium]
MKMKMYKIVMIAVATMFIASAANAQTLDGTTWSYAERVYGDSKISEVTTYFAFTSPTSVIWYFGAPDNFVFPVGFGSYDAKNSVITFSHTNPLHKKISLYYGDNTIVFGFRIVNGQAPMTCKNEKIMRRFTGEQPFKLNREKYSLKPNSKLAGTNWRYNIDNNNKGTLYFKSANEALIDGEIHPYVCLGNSVSIKSGDNLGENMLGIYNSESIKLCRGGIENKMRDICVIIERIRE